MPATSPVTYKKYCPEEGIQPKRTIVILLQSIRKSEKCLQGLLLHEIFSEQKKLREIVEENRQRIEEVEKSLKSATDEWSNSTASTVSS